MNASTSAWSWRTVDIVVAAAIAVAFGVVFWAWGAVWSATAPAFAFLPPSQYLLYGVWLVPGVLGGLVVRKPFAALFTELVAAIVSALLGAQWGLDTLISGVLQGGAAELVFALGRYRVWNVASAALAGGASALAAWIHDMPLYFPELPIDAWLVFAIFMVVSAVAIAGVGSWLLYRALANAGALSAFASGRGQPRV
jgi:energy-coupling factor transport system substrate-specific component